MWEGFHLNFNHLPLCLIWGNDCTKNKFHKEWYTSVNTQGSSSYISSPFYEFLKHFRHNMKILYISLSEDYWCGVTSPCDADFTSHIPDITDMLVIEKHLPVVIQSRIVFTFCRWPWLFFFSEDIWNLWWCVPVKTVQDSHPPTKPVRRRFCFEEQLLLILPL